MAEAFVAPAACLGHAVLLKSASGSSNTAVCTSVRTSHLSRSARRKLGFSEGRVFGAGKVSFLKGREIVRSDSHRSGFRVPTTASPASIRCEASESSATAAPEAPVTQAVSSNGTSNGTASSAIVQALLPKTGKFKGKRTDIKKILLLGSGPIVIGSACEFDYSGSQACKALRAEGYEVVLINSNPATIMTDPETANQTYVGPMTMESIEKIIALEKPDAVLPTMGGQTALNLAMDLSKAGILDKYGCELIGAKEDAIRRGEDRLEFKALMEELKVPTPKAGVAHNLAEAKEIAEYIGTYPLIIRPAFTMGGSGGGVAYNQEEFERMAQYGIELSPVSEILVELSLIGWKEYEFEVMRDLEDNVVIICTIENLDPMGVHTGDSITVAPIQTLNDREFQMLRDASIAIIRGVGVETGGSNIQFAVNPRTGDYIAIEMNPRVSRSSALASKATGFPIAKFAAKLATGLNLVDIKNDITKMTPACFEPTIDYVVVKIPRFAFEKFPGAEPILTTQMKSVGEAMAIGRTFNESFQKCVRSLETGRAGWGCDREEEVPFVDEIRRMLITPNPERVYSIRHAFMRGMTVDDVYALTEIDHWFLEKMLEIYQYEVEMLTGVELKKIGKEEMLALKQQGFSDRQIAYATRKPELEVRAYRKSLGVVPVYKTVDTCAAEFEAFTPYYYSTYEASGETETKASDGRKKVMILGGGPNRIGQGIEFDYCCCHASYALRDAGYETIMVNSNPETVSTDYDTSDRLYFEPLTLEDVCNIIDAERPDGIIISFGGQTPLKLALGLQKYVEAMPEDGKTRTKIWGTSPDSIDVAEDRERFEKILRELDIPQPPNGLARNYLAAQEVVSKIKYPVVVRPSYVLGGRAMAIVYDDKELEEYFKMVMNLAEGRDFPILVDHFLEDAIEVDVDAIGDTEGNYVIGGIMEHIEQAGIHSGDSACSIPTQNLSDPVLNQIRKWTIDIARSLNVVGLINIQWAVQGEKVFILEANPRASRTVPFVSKAIGVPLAKVASLAMSGITLKELGFTEEIIPKHVSVKEVVLPFDKFPGTDTLLGPEMRSTGEVMGIDDTFGPAFAKAQIAAFQKLPLKGTVFVSCTDRTKHQVVQVVKDFQSLGFQVVATTGTRKHLLSQGVEVESVRKLTEGRPNVVDWIKNGWIQMIVMTAAGADADMDGKTVRRTALQYKVPLVTTIAGAKATAAAIKAMQAGPLDVKSLQAYNMETHGHGAGLMGKLKALKEGTGVPV